MANKYLTIIEWGGMKPPTVWYDFVSRRGHANRERYRWQTVTGHGLGNSIRPHAGAVGSDRVMDSDPAVVCVQEGVFLCRDYGTAQKIALEAGTVIQREQAKAAQSLEWNNGLSEAQTKRLTAQAEARPQIMIVAAHADNVQMIDATADSDWRYEVIMFEEARGRVVKRGRKPAADWLVSCNACGETHLHENTPRPEGCPACFSLDIALRNVSGVDRDSLFVPPLAETGLEATEYWLRSRFLSGQFMIPPERSGATLPEAAADAPDLAHHVAGAGALVAEIDAGFVEDVRLAALDSVYLFRAGTPRAARDNNRALCLTELMKQAQIHGLGHSQIALIERDAPDWADAIGLFDGPQIMAAHIVRHAGQA